MIFRFKNYILFTAKQKKQQKNNYKKLKNNQL